MFEENEEILLAKLETTWNRKKGTRDSDLRAVDVVRELDNVSIE